MTINKSSRNALCIRRKDRIAYPDGSSAGRRSIIISNYSFCTLSANKKKKINKRPTTSKNK